MLIKNFVRTGATYFDVMVWEAIEELYVKMNGFDVPFPHCIFASHEDRKLFN